MKRTDGSERPSRHRDLTREEIELWRQVTRTIAPFEGRRIKDLADKHPDNAGLARPVVTSSSHRVVSLPGYTPSPQRPTIGLTPLSPLERRLKQRLSRGRVDVDAVMDLHGMRQAEAHAAIRNFLHAAQASGAKLVLVITGKGGSPGSEARHDQPEGGVLRRSVPQWLRAPDLRGIIVGFEEASHTHGGSGALYIRVRRAGRPAGERS